jgi:hypothetical protein
MLTLAMTAFAIRSRAGSPTCASAATASETCSLIISQYILRGRVRHEFDADVPLGNVAQPRGPVQGTDISRGSAPEHAGPSGSGGASTAFAAIACMAIVVHGFCPGPAHTDEQTCPPGLSTRANSAVALATSGKNMYPNRTEILSQFHPACDGFVTV